MKKFKLKITENVTKFIISPLIGAVLFLLIFRLEFRFYTIWRIIGVFLAGLAVVVVANLFAEVINQMFGEVKKE